MCVCVCWPADTCLHMQAAEKRLGSLRCWSRSRKPRPKAKVRQCFFFYSFRETVLEKGVGEEGHRCIALEMGDISYSCAETNNMAAMPSVTMCVNALCVVHATPFNLNIIHCVCFLHLHHASPPLLILYPCPNCACPFLVGPASALAMPNCSNGCNCTQRTEP